METVTLTIDGRPVTVKKGKTGGEVTVVVEDTW